MRSIYSALYGKRSCALSAVCLLWIFLLGACGGGTSAPSSIQNRIFVSNTTGTAGTTPPNGVAVAPGIQIINAANDTLSPSSISVTGAAQMITAGGTNGTTVVFGNGTNTISIIDNAKEAVTFTFGTADTATDMALTSNAATAFAAVRGPGQLVVVTTDDDNGFGLNIPSVSRLVVSPTGTKVLAFVDNPQTLVDVPQNSLFIIDVASSSVTPVSRAGSCSPNPVPTLPALCDQPYTAVFNNSETNAFILNCGAECGGTTASVVDLDFSGSTPTFGTPIPVAGATVGLLNGSNLFVAGSSPSTPGNGTLSVINTGNSTVSNTFTITDGLHKNMAMASNNNLYIGAGACTLVPNPGAGTTQGCLSIFNTSSSALVFPQFPSIRAGFDVTAIAPIGGRTVVYVAEGGVLDIYDTSLGNQLATIQVDIVGQAVNVVQVDQPAPTGTISND
jgi:hypothetical protein